MLELIGELVDARARLRRPRTAPATSTSTSGRWPAYGELTHQKIDDMEPAEDADPRGKRDPRDFALWKGAQGGRAGDRRLAVAVRAAAARAGTSSARRWPRKYLGDAFDIHGGGVDLRFPHHENEQAQSRAAGLGVRVVLAAQRLGHHRAARR